jgi:hypothetical protein
MTKPNRRTIDAALSIPALHRNFIAGQPSSDPLPPTATPPVADAAPTIAAAHELSPASVIDGAPATVAAGETAEPAARRSSRRPTAHTARPQPAHRPSAAPTGSFFSPRSLLIPLTTRVTVETGAALRRASLENRLTGRTPATVQEIAELAIGEWLEREGWGAKND